MSFDKVYPNRKDWRKPYWKSKAVDRDCRPGGTCPFCQGSLQHKHRKRLAAAVEAEREFFSDPPKEKT